MTQRDHWGWRARIGMFIVGNEAVPEAVVGDGPTGCVTAVRRKAGIFPQPTPGTRAPDSMLEAAQ